MGVDLKDLVPRSNVSIDDLEGKKLGVDAFNWLYQFLSIIRQRDGTPLKDSKGRVTSHLTGLFYRTAKLLEAGVKLCYVFDGKPPEFKKVTASRVKRRKKARKAYEKAKAAGDYEKAYSKAMQSSRLTSQMVIDAKKLLEAFGLPVIQAPSEGEAQAAFMTLKGDLYAAATQDYDAVLFGAPRVIRNLNITGRRRRGNAYVSVSPELVLFDEVLKETSLSHEELVTLAVLIGTDYNPGGVKGIGPKRGLKLVKEHGVDAWKEVNWDWDINPPDIIGFFMNPPVLSDYELSWRAPDKDKIIKLLVDDYEFSRDRISSTLKKVMKAAGQAGLGEFL
ncbi:flap endonuclease-1 [archaeon]|nr:flap endonuclease-1 [archaeon]